MQYQKVIQREHIQTGPNDAETFASIFAKSLPNILTNAGGVMTDVELKMWAFDKTAGWGTLKPQADPAKPPEYRDWTLDERMAKADEIVAWLRTPLPKEPTAP